MNGSDSQRTGAPAWRSLPNSLPRPRLFAQLDRGSPLTVLDAPRGFGKRTLLATWLDNGGAPGRRIVWVPPLTDADGPHALWSAVLQAWGEEPAPLVSDTDDVVVRVLRLFRRAGTYSLLVLSGVTDTYAQTVLDDVLHLLDHCPLADAAVCLPGGNTDLTDLVERGLDFTYIPAGELVFSSTETAEMFRLGGTARDKDETTELCRILGGVPVLISSAAALARHTPQRLVDAKGVPAPTIHHVVRRYALARLGELGTELRKFALTVVAYHSLTAEEATELTGVSDAEDALGKLAAAGLVSGTRYDGPHAWKWADAVRAAVLEISREEYPGCADEMLTRIAERHRRAGRPALAAIYAVEAGAWGTAIEIVETSWVTMVDRHFEVLVKVLRWIPESEMADHPAVLAGRALFTQMFDEHAILHAPLPSDPEELAELGRAPDAAESVFVGTAQTLTLRVAGEIREAARLTLAMKPLVNSILEHRPEAIGPHLPVLRLQWGVTLQLAGELTEAAVVLRRAYRGAYASDIVFVVKNAAGSSALNWAVAGDNPRAREWLRVESNADRVQGRWSELVRVPGLVAGALVHLDALDTHSARIRLDDLGVPRVSEELWGFIAYARAYYDLATGNAYDGLTALHRLISSHHDRFGPGTFSRTLLAAAEVDLQLALGNGNLARALAYEVPARHPIPVVAAARVEILTGHPDVALKKLRVVSWAECGFPRAHLEALLIEAAAHLELGDEDAARRSWSRARALAESVDNRRAFTLLPPGTVQRLVEFTGVAGPAESVESVFVEPVVHVELSPRETDVLGLLAQGSTHADIAKKLFVSPNTIKTQVRSIYRKLGAHTRVEAIARARELKLLGHRES